MSSWFSLTHITSHAIIKLYNTALAGLDDKTAKTDAVLLGISKACGCVNHDILITKLHYVDIYQLLNYITWIYTNY